MQRSMFSQAPNSRHSNVRARRELWRAERGAFRKSPEEHKTTLLGRSRAPIHKPIAHHFRRFAESLQKPSNLAFLDAVSMIDRGSIFLQEPFLDPASEEPLADSKRSSHRGERPNLSLLIVEALPDSVSALAHGAQGARPGEEKHDFAFRFCSRVLPPRVSIRKG